MAAGSSSLDDRYLAVVAAPADADARVLCVRAVRREEVRRSRCTSPPRGDRPVVEERTAGATVVEGVGQQADVNRVALVGNLQDDVTQADAAALSPRARRRPRSSSSDAASDWSLAAWTASSGGSIVTGQAYAGAVHGCHPARGARVAATSDSRLESRARRRLAVEQLERKDVMVECDPALEPEAPARVM